MAVSNARPVQEGLYTWPSDAPQLVASKCATCGEVTFPKQDGCPRCTEKNAEDILLGRRGTLWTWTIQRFPPPPPFIGPADPDRFTPYGVGYVELPEGVRVEGRLAENDPSKLEIGMEMELVVEEFTRDADGNPLLTFAFRPVEAVEE